MKSTPLAHKDMAVYFTYTGASIQNWLDLWPKHPRRVHYRSKYLYKLWNRRYRETV